jgi:hypothetical protein
VSKGRVIIKIPTLKQHGKQVLKEKELKEKEVAKELQLAKRPVGRPRSSELASKTKRNSIGRPKGEAAIMQEYKARMLASPKSRRVIEAIFDAALNDDHKHQASAWKLLVDRLMPVSMFEKEIDPNGGSVRPTINISIGTVGDKPFTIDNEDVQDG